MRYKVYCDDSLIFDTQREDLKLFEPQLDLEVNKTGSFTFTIDSAHPHYDKLKKLKSIIKVYQDNYLLFRGRILNDGQGWYNEKQVSCEGELAFLLDSIQRPYDFQSGENHTTVSELFTYFITNHNAQVDTDKQFKVGNITVTDENDYIVRADSTYLNTWESIEKKLIDSFGGYLWVRHESDGNYIDYLSDFTTLSPQAVEFGKNLLSLTKTIKGENIATALIPLGAKIVGEDGNETEQRVMITDLTDETSGDIRKKDDYVYSVSAVEQYGYIFKSQTWDDVTEASNLLRKAKAQLAVDINLSASIELSAADLAAVDSDIGAFHIGNYIKVKTTPHGIDSNFLVKKLSISLLNPASNKMTVGMEYETFTEQSNNINKNLGKVTQDVEGIKNDYANIAQDITQQISSEISQSSDEILSRVSEDYYLKSETDKLIGSVSTEVSQTKDEINIRFDQFNQDIGDLQAGTDAKFQDISKYIRFVDGKIILGVVGNELILQQQNDRISFIQSGNEVAYFSNNKLYVTDGEFLNSMKLGKFAFLPRANGNLSFVKVVD